MDSTLSKSLAAFAAFGLLMLNPVQAWADDDDDDDCEVLIEPQLSQWTIRYNPLEDEVAVRSFDIRLENKGRKKCRGNLDVSLRNSPFGLSSQRGNERIRYVLQQIEPSGPNLTPSSGESPRRPGGSIELGRRESRLVRVTFAASPAEDVSAGSYTQTVFVGFGEGRDRGHSGRPVVLALDVAAAAAIGLKGEFSRPNGTPVIDLGELTEGPRPLNTALYVHSTGGYRVSISSANRGRLRQGATAWYVDYKLKVGAQNINLERADDFNVVSQTARRDDYPLAVRIGDVSGKRAGEYSDTLTFTVAAI